MAGIGMVELGALRDALKTALRQGGVLDAFQMTAETTDVENQAMLTVTAGQVVFPLIVQSAKSGMSVLLGTRWVKFENGKFPPKQAGPAFRAALALARQAHTAGKKASEISQAAIQLLEGFTKRLNGKETNGRVYVGDDGMLHFERAGLVEAVVHPSEESVAQALFTAFMK